MKNLTNPSVFTFFGGSDSFITISVYSKDAVLVVFHHSNGGRKFFLYGLMPMADNDYVIMSYMELFTLITKNVAMLESDASIDNNETFLNDIELLADLATALSVESSENFNVHSNQKACFWAVDTVFDDYLPALHNLFDYYSSSLAPVGYEFSATTKNEEWIAVCGSHVGKYHRANTLLELFSILLRQLTFLQLSLCLYSE